MTLEGLDVLDQQIVHELQRDARRTSSQQIADEAGVSASTVRNRIQRLQERGIVRGYHADVDYEQAGYQLYTLIVCTAPVTRREELAAVAGRDACTTQTNDNPIPLHVEHDATGRGRQGVCRG